MNSPDVIDGGKRAATPRKPRAVKATTTRPNATAISPDERRRMIEVRAYFLAEQRGFAPGRDQQDWLDAEAQVDVMLAPAAAGVSKRRSSRTTQ